MKFMKKIMIILFIIPCCLWGETDEDFDKSLSNLCKDNANVSFCSILEKFKHGTVPKFGTTSCIIIGEGQKYSFVKNPQNVPKDYYAILIKYSTSNLRISFIKLIPENNQEVVELKNLLQAGLTGNSINQNEFLSFLRSQFENQVFDEIDFSDRSIRLKYLNAPNGILRQFEDNLILVQIVLGAHKRPSIFLFSAGLKQCFPASRSDVA
ncbi:hypothetical protein EHO58_01600 [Leptospira selangorensis]|uniref:hypothetical protein n=1 Tax=Leptospira selangorensis TaxID=2484982 RepID=UPI0010832367|nr:hypothetical protein [Leptospira selangorensis]TGK10145.1 hypothetical protein EHO58_01600 [Leptospira selangorensis]